MARTKAAKTRRDADPWRAKVVAKVTEHPGMTVGDVSRQFPAIARAQVWALLSSACSRSELVCKPDKHVFRFYPKED